jgi:hypothetical protein
MLTIVMWAIIIFYVFMCIFQGKHNKKFINKILKENSNWVTETNIENATMSIKINNDYIKSFITIEDTISELINNFSLDNTQKEKLETVITYMDKVKIDLELLNMEYTQKISTYKKEILNEKEQVGKKS